VTYFKTGFKQNGNLITLQKSNKITLKVHSLYFLEYKNVGAFSDPPSIKLSKKIVNFPYIKE